MKYKKRRQLGHSGRGREGSAIGRMSQKRQPVCTFGQFDWVISLPSTGHPGRRSTAPFYVDCLYGPKVQENTHGAPELAVDATARGDGEFDGGAAIACSGPLISVDPHITPVRPEIAAVTVPKVSSAQGVTRVRFTAKFRTPSITSCRRALCMPRLLLA